MRIRILRSAREDLIDSFWFYENQCEGLGNYFWESLENDIDKLLFTAGSHKIVHSKHRMIASRFPHSIFYLVEGNEINIYAVIDNRRNPNWISDKLN